MTFGEKLKELRESKNLSGRKLARKLGKSHTHIRNLEKDENGPSPELIAEIVDLFGNTQQEKGGLEFELCCLAGILTERLRTSIAEFPYEYRQLEEKLSSVKKQKAKTRQKILQIRLQQPRPLGAVASHMQRFEPELPNLPIIGQEAGYTLLYLESPRSSTIRVSSKEKPFTGLHMRVLREGRDLLEGVTDKNGDVDISDVKLKGGDIIELDAPLQFIVNESVLRSF